MKLTNSNKKSYFSSHILLLLNPSFLLIANSPNENLELKEALEKSSKLITADKMSTVSTMSTYGDDAYTSNDILSFECSLPYKDIQRYMQDLFQKTGGNGRV